jgi:hypothetical protein
MHPRAHTHPIARLPDLRLRPLLPVLRPLAPPPLARTPLPDLLAGVYVQCPAADAAEQHLRLFSAVAVIRREERADCAAEPAEFPQGPDVGGVRQVWDSAGGHVG